MKKDQLPTYSELNQALSKTSLKLHPSQVHGLICGILCGNPNSSNAWEEIVTGDGKPSGKTHEMLQSLYDATAKQFADFLFEFQLVIPSDSHELQERAEALTLWCQGYLTGLKLTGIAIVDRKPGEITEAIDDIIEIAKMDYEDVVASEEDEAAYVELIEYVRMAAILIYQDLRENEDKKQPTSNLH